MRSRFPPTTQWQHERQIDDATPIYVWILILGGVYSSELRGRNLKKENVGQMEFGNVNAHRLASTGLGQFSADDSWFTACFLVSPRHVFLSHLLHSIRQNSENTKEGANERTIGNE
jgi:hypothetical protein